MIPGRLPPRDLGLILLVVFVWGVNFTAIRWGLDEMPPLFFVALRYGLLLPLIVVLPRPAGWGAILGVGLFINTAQFALLFSAMQVGLSAGLASLLIQSQAPLTILLSALIFGERVSRMQGIGVLIALAGLGIFALSTGTNATTTGLALVLAGALCWSMGNLVIKRTGRVNMLALFVWASIVPPLPLLGLSLALEDVAPLATLQALSPLAWASVAFNALGATALGFSLWGTLLARHPAATVAPFALLIPVFGMGTAAILLGERLSLPEILGGLVVLTGLALTQIRRAA